MDDADWRTDARHAGEAIEEALGTGDPEQAVARLTAASRALEDALAEAMAAAVLEGSSMRRVAEITGLAPNSVPPRLARSRSLGPYADEGSVSAQGIAVARYAAAAESGHPPLKFTPRRRDAHDQS